MKHLIHKHEQEISETGKGEGIGTLASEEKYTAC